MRSVRLLDSRHIQGREMVHFQREISFSQHFLFLGHCNQVFLFCYVLIWLLRKIIIFWNPTWCLTGGKSILIYFSGAIYSINIFPCPCQLFQLLTGNSIRNEILLEGVLKKCFIFIILKILFQMKLWGNLFSDILFFHSFGSNTSSVSCQSLIFLLLFGYKLFSEAFPPLSPHPLPHTPCRPFGGSPSADSPKDALEALPNPYFTK